MGLALETIDYYDNGGGLNLKSSPTKIPEDEASLSQNIDYSIDGALLTRNGSRIQNVTAGGLPNQIAGAPRGLYMFDYKKSDATQVQILCAGTNIYHGLNTATLQALPIVISSQNIPDIEFFVTGDDEWAVWGNGVDTDLKFDGTNYTFLSIVGPTLAPIVADAGAGVLPAGDYFYYYQFVREVGGVVVQESDLSPAGTVTIAINHNINVNVLASADPQVTGIRIFRASTAAGFSGQVRFLTRLPNAAALFVDNIITESSILGDFDNQAAPKSAIFEEYNGFMVYADALNPTDYLVSKKDKCWNVPENSRTYLDGAITCIRRLYGALIIGTNAPSLWVINGDPDVTGPRRISSEIGILNNRCAAGESQLYILATNRRFYAINPTDFSQNEIRPDIPTSIKIEPLISTMSVNALNDVSVEYYSAPNVAKAVIACPIGLSTNNTLIVYNETQATLKEKPVWQVWENMEPATLRQMRIGGEIGLYSMDYNGFVWKLDDRSIFGDGAAVNGTSSGGNAANTLNHIVLVSTATGGGVNTLIDATQNFAVNSLSQKTLEITAGTGVGQSGVILGNTATVITITAAWGVIPDATSVYRIGNFIAGAYVGTKVRIIGGTGDVQIRKIVSNTGTQLVVSPAWSTIPDATSQYTIGGYIVYHYTNWKPVLNSYNDLKQLWFIWVNANANGNYTVELLIQTDFDQTEVNAQRLLVNLRSLNTIWGDFIWGEAPWGARAVFQDRYRAFSRFNSIRIGFRSKQAAHPFQINGFSISAQNKKLMFRTFAG